MAITHEEAQALEGFRAILTLPNDDGTAREVDVKVETVSPFGIMYRERGKLKVDLVVLGDIIEARPAPEDISSIKIKTLKPVMLGKARQHLASEHGYFVSKVGVMSEEAAFKFHAELDHTDLAHVHQA